MAHDPVTVVPMMSAEQTSSVGTSEYSHYEPLLRFRLRNTREAA